MTQENMNVRPAVPIQECDAVDARNVRIKMLEKSLAEERFMNSEHNLRIANIIYFYEESMSSLKRNIDQTASMDKVEATILKTHIDKNVSIVRRAIVGEIEKPVLTEAPAIGGTE